jgi:hypothetical protein
VRRPNHAAILLTLFKSVLQACDGDKAPLVVVLPKKGRQLGCDLKMAAAILLVTSLRMSETDWAFFAVRCDGQSLCRDAEGNQVLPHCQGPFFAQHKIVGGAPPFVAMTFDLDVSAAMAQ